MESPINTVEPPKKKRGRPRKQNTNLVFGEPSAPPAPPPPEAPSIVLEEPVSNYVEVVNLSNDQDLEDIKKRDVAEFFTKEVPLPPEPEVQVPDNAYIPPEPIQYPQPVMEVGMGFNQPAEESPKDFKERKDLIQKIRKYRETFEIVNRIGFDENGSLFHLRAVLEETRNIVSNRNTSILMKRSYITGCQGLELIGSKVGAKLQGYTDLMSRSAEVDSILAELRCEINVGYVPPWKRLMFVSLSSAYVVHSLNSKASLVVKFANDPVKPEVASKYNDL